MRDINPELICPGHRDVLPCSKQDLDIYCDFIEQKERVFRNLVNEPADHYIDLFWARLLPYLATVAANEAIEYRLLLRNNFSERTSYGARLIPPQGWKTSPEFAQLELEPGDRGELSFAMTAPPTADTDAFTPETPTPPPANF